MKKEECAVGPVLSRILAASLNKKYITRASVASRLNPNQDDLKIYI